MLKKILIATLCAAMVSAVALTGCSSGESTTSSSASESSQTESTVVSNSSDSTLSSAEESGSESSATASVDTEAFEALFAQNPIDAAYETQMNEVSTNQEIISVTNTFSGLWNDEISHAYSELLKKTQGSEKEAIEKDQSNWNATKDGQLQEIENSITGDGSTIQMERAIRVKDFYRDKAKSLYEKLYQYEPDFTYIYTPY